jgi:hypothetical protein
METNPQKKPPFDYSQYPGKMDHSTALVFSICTTKDFLSAALLIVRLCRILTQPSGYLRYTFVWDFPLAEYLV